MSSQMFPIQVISQFGLAVTTGKWLKNVRAAMHVVQSPHKYLCCKEL